LAERYERLSSTARGYNARWRRFRLHYLRENPLCVRCLKDSKSVPASVVDHVEPHKGDMVKFWEGPFQALCTTCHDGYKQRLEKSGRETGCDGNGVPLDPGHFWNK
jgi:5-methylcytosine-specific restriction protein A